MEESKRKVWERKAISKPSLKFSFKNIFIAKEKEVSQVPIPAKEWKGNTELISPPIKPTQKRKKSGNIVFTIKKTAISLEKEAKKDNIAKDHFIYSESRNFLSRKLINPRKKEKNIKNKTE